MHVCMHLIRVADRAGPWGQGCNDLPYPTRTAGFFRCLTQRQRGQVITTGLRVCARVLLVSHTRDLRQRVVYSSRTKRFRGAFDHKHSSTPRSALATLSVVEQTTPENDGVPMRDQMVLCYVLVKVQYPQELRPGSRLLKNANSQGENGVTGGSCEFQTWGHGEREFMGSTENTTYNRKHR